MAKPPPATKPPDNRLVAPERREDDIGDASLRPQRLSEFVGQEQARQNLQIFIDAARKRGEALDHVLFVGPPGLGKTTLAQIVSRELGVGFRATSGPVIAKAGVKNVAADHVDSHTGVLQNVRTAARPITVVAA